VQSLIAMGMSTSFAMLLIKSVFPHPVGPSSMTFDFSSRGGGFRCVHVRSNDQWCARSMTYAALQILHVVRCILLTAPRNLSRLGLVGHLLAAQRLLDGLVRRAPVRR
jgi:hypothetical protein